MADPRVVEQPLIRAQYHFRQVGEHTHIWDVRRLLKLASGLPVQSVPLTAISELDEPYWHAHPPSLPSIRNITNHMRQTLEADLDYPILLCADGRVMGGMHRVSRAFLNGNSHINAQRLIATPPPDYIDLDADDLTYA